MNTIISSVNFNVSIYFVSSTDESFAFVSQGMSKVLYSVLLSHCYCLSNDFQSFQMSTVQKPIPTYYSSQSQQEQAVAWTNQNSKQSVVTLSIHSMGKIACARCNNYWFWFCYHCLKNWHEVLHQSLSLYQLQSCNNYYFWQ